MAFFNESELLALKDRYRTGDRVRVIFMPHHHYTLPEGAMGTILGFDCDGALNVMWDGGYDEKLIPTVDYFNHIPYQNGTPIQNKREGAFND